MTAALDRGRPPAAGPPRGFSFPDFSRHRLANGLELWLAPIDRLPLVDLQLVLDAGSTRDPAAASGLAQFTAAVVDEGTETRGSHEIADTVERLGGYLSSSSGWESLDISCGLLSRHLDTGLEMVADIARRATFPEPEVERLRGQLVAEIERRETQPSALAGRHLAAAIYDDGVYGRTRIGTVDSLTAIEREDLVEFHQHHVTPGGAAFLLCGDFDPEVAVKRTEELFGDWPAATAPERPALATPTPRPRHVTLVDRPGAQTELRLGHAGPPRRSSDFLASTILNAILGGKFMSRINLNLRERNGYTYGASSYFDWRRGPGPFVVSTAVATEHAAAAAREVLSEIELLRQEPVTAEELEETRNYLVGVFPYTNQKLSGVSARLRQMAIHQLPEDYYATWVEAVATVTVDDVFRAAHEHLHPDRLAIVAVGPAGELTDGFSALGPVRTVSTAPTGRDGLS